MVSDEQIRQALADITAGDILLIDFEIPQPQVMFALEMGRAAGATTVLNPAPYFTRDAFVVDYLHLVDVLIPNRLEAQLILGSESDDLDELANLCWASTDRDGCSDDGESGQLLYGPGNPSSPRSQARPRVIRSGASDAFVGA